MKYIIPALVLVAIVYCPAGAQQRITGPHAVVYKTRKDYADKVPVTLSADKSKIVSYPDPADVKNGNGFSTPTQLHKGYLLDNRGIGKNTAFLDITYEGYNKMPSPVSSKELYKHILDKNPISEMCDCGKKVKNEVKTLNKQIDKGNLKKYCKQII